MSIRSLNRRVGEKPNARFLRRRAGTVDSQSEREAYKDAQATDVIILVMGKTGAGKSTFINTLLGNNDAMEVGNDMECCTRIPKSETLSQTLVDSICPEFEGPRVVIVDTPGFDMYRDKGDTNRVDSLALTKAWLATSYKPGTRCSGIIFLQDITERRMEEAGSQELKLTKELCGSKAFHRTILVTTGWKENTQDGIGDDREKELKASKFWKEMIAKGSPVMRFDLTQSSAFTIMRQMLISNDPVLGLALEIQKMISISLSPSQNLRVKELRQSIDRILETHRRLHPEEEREKEDLQRRIQALEAQMRPLVGLRSMFTRRM